MFPVVLYQVVSKIYDPIFTWTVHLIVLHWLCIGGVFPFQKKESRMNDLLETLQLKLCTGEPHVNVRIVAAHFGVSIWSIYRMAESGKIPSYKVGGKRSFKISELESTFRRYDH